jgi:hypothetical protein
MQVRSFADGCIVSCEVGRRPAEFDVVSSYLDRDDGKVWYILRNRATLETTKRREDWLALVDITFDHHPLR